ncbi:ATP-binding protein [uncultured Intestinimonas sp.]|uniref:ATP-binding protein n=1 Tax=uncultured Intestinimonas sp. TaxID=1689265 RepID=UPI0025CF4656|nr:ATP-binding protein [uncultured Intestinimonas sp.]
MTTSLLAAVSSVLALGLLLWVLRLRKTLRREREENQRLRRLLRVGSQAASTDLAQMKKLRHDLRQYLTLAEASAVLRDAPDPAPPVGELESWAVSALKRHYLERAKVLGFQADLQITLPQTWEDAIPDVCLVLNNLLENAIEALQREGGGWLRAGSIATSGYFSLVVGNSCTKPLRTLGGRYLSSKAPGRFGIGLETVQEIAKRYGGLAEFTVENGAFRASVFLLRP